MSFEDFLQKQSDIDKGKQDKWSVKEILHICECIDCGKTFDTKWEICPSCGSKHMSYETKKVTQVLTGYERALQNKYNRLIAMAQTREEALDYDAAIQIWEKLGDIKGAARVRRLKTRQKSVRVAQKVVKGNEINRTEIKDSVLNRSNVGGGSSKMKELRELKEMFDSGFISKEEMEDMKKEILGK
jgi:uncharacterized OB-fold protein